MELSPMERFYLQWNIVNWITVVLMAAVGMMIVGAIASGLRQYGGASSDNG
ncbi:MAG: hypothetical protein KGJ13_11210 [Patescibacteria group bacterium]|nr:hypothetical protein [Patescibacteria group bacterium]